MKILLFICVILSIYWSAQAQRGDEIPVDQIKAETQVDVGEIIPSRDVSSDNKPLVRCKRPMCDDLACPKGYQLDSRGCETCSCLTSECDTMDCGPGSRCVEKSCTSFPCIMLLAECVATESQPTPPALPCPMPMCASPCPYGRKVTSEGCETCECSSVEPTPKTECPMLKCSMCAFGYVRDDNGCHTCNCLPDPCSGKVCPEHQQCTARWDDCFHVPCPKVAACAWRGLCLYNNDNKQLMTDLHVPTDGMSTDCNADGTFNPVQCTSQREQCWCVDDTGREIEKTRIPVYSDEDVPTCPYNKTVSILMTFVLESEDDVDVNLPDLKTTVHEHISRWLLIEKHYINELEIWEEPGAVIVVSYMVVHDGKTDLPSAAGHLSRQMQHGQCAIDFQGNTLKPRSDSLEMTHTFEPISPPRMSDPGLLQSDDQEHHCFLRRWYKHHRSAFMVGAIGGFIILSFVTIVIVSVLVNRHRRSVQFRHKRMSNYQKNLSLVAESSYLPVVEEKKDVPCVEEAVGLFDSTEKLVPPESPTPSVVA